MVCKSIKRNGKPCKQTDVNEEGYCKYHCINKRTISQEKCKATKRNGKPCSQIDINEEGYCKYHNTSKYKTIPL